MLHCPIILGNIINNLKITQVGEFEFPQQFKEAGLNSPLVLTGATWQHLLTEAPTSANKTLLYSPSHYMLQDTKQERQLPVSRTAYCTLPDHKIHCESNSGVVLPVMGYYTCCLRTVLVIFQRWWHEIARLAVPFFSENAYFVLSLKKRKKRKEHCENTCTLPKTTELLRQNQPCDKVINWQHSFDIRANSCWWLTQRKTPPHLTPCWLLRNAASWHIENRPLRNFAPEQASIKIRVHAVSAVLTRTLKPCNFQLSHVPVQWLWQGKRKKSSLIKGRHARREADENELFRTTC